MISYQNIVSQLRAAISFPSPYLITHHYAVPIKYEHVVFCRLSDFQLSLYRLFIKSPEIRALLRGTESQPLKAINILKKLCNHPELLDLPGDLAGSEELIPEGFVGASSLGNGLSAGRGREARSVTCEWGGKFVVLERSVLWIWMMKIV